MSLLIGLFTFVLILLAIFMVLVILVQKPRSDAGMGAAMGGGFAEATFGAETSSILTKTTIRGSVAFFLLAFLLYLGHIHLRAKALDSGEGLPSVVVPAADEALPGSSTTGDRPGE